MKCVSCAKESAGFATYCPHCGAKQPATPGRPIEKVRVMSPLGIAIVAAAIAGLAGLILWWIMFISFFCIEFDTTSCDEKEAGARTMSYFFLPIVLAVGGLTAFLLSRIKRDPDA